MTKVTATNINFTQPSIQKTQSSTYASRPIFTFDGKYSPVKQPENQYDCWLLAGLSSMNTTEWGKKAIKDAIEPDNMGGVYISFPGSPIEQKRFYVSVEDMLSAKKSGRYSSGDDDVLAIELAAEKLFKYMHDNNLGQVDRQKQHDSYLGGMITNIYNSEYLSIEELLTGVNEIPFSRHNGITQEQVNATLNKLAGNTKDYSFRCTFHNCKENDAIYPGHAFGVVKIVPNKYVILSDSYENRNVKISWNEFTRTILNFTISSKDSESREKVKKMLPENYDNIRQNSLKYYDELRKKNNKKYSAELKDAEKVKNKYESELNTLKNINKTFNALKSSIENDSYKDLLAKIEKLNDSERFFLLKTYKEELIKLLDNKAWGWGKGEKKKNLIMPFINSLEIKVKEYEPFEVIERGFRYIGIEDIKEVVLSELDATFYTDESTIIRNINDEYMENILKNIQREFETANKFYLIKKEQMDEFLDNAF